MEHISDRYRAYALDFWGFGESDRRLATYTLPEYVTMVLDFIDALGVQKINLVGHGLGGMVALLAAAQRPETFPKVLTVCTPFQGGQLQAHAKASTFERLFGRSNPLNGWVRMLQRLDLDDKQVQREIIEDTETLTEAVVNTVFQSLTSTDLRSELRQTQAQLLAVYGERDTFVEASQGDYLRDDHPVLQQVIRLPKSGHFPFLSEEKIFNRLLQDFLASQGTEVEIKTEWRRRVSQLEYI
jgi:pimeloyl-ACP methyl ester carboxylesterase